MAYAGLSKKLWRITISSLFPNGERTEGAYDGLSVDENAASEGALAKEAFDHGGSTIATVTCVEEIE